VGEMVKTLVVTGSQGFIGQRLVARLATSFQVLAVDVRPPLRPLPGVIYHQIDLAQPENLIPMDMTPSPAFQLVHLAWDMNRNNASFTSQAGQVSLLASLLETWAERGLSRAILLGSAEEYGERSGALKPEDEPCGRVSPYGWAKQAAWKMASAFSLRSAIPIMWMRPFVVYGPGQNGTMLIPYAIHQIRQGKPAEFSDGRQFRDFLYVDDLLDALWKTITLPWDGVVTMNLGFGVPVRVSDVLNELKDLLKAGELFRIGVRPWRLGEPDVQFADISTACQILRWIPSTDWRKGLRLTCEEELSC
jgi:nucleoside-diphosphate-sugar epimerase